MKWYPCALVGAVVAAAPLSAQSLYYEGGASVASGRYIFTERTTGWTVYNGLAFGAGPVTLRTTLPVYLQNTTLVTSSGTGPVPSGGASSGAVADSSASRQQRGRGMRSDGSVEVPASAVTDFEAAVGDPTVGLTLTVLDRGGLFVSAGAVAKIPLTDTTDFGSGEWDVGGSISLSRSFGLSTLLSVDVAYWRLGDLPDLELRDPLLVSASAAYLALSGWGGSVGFSGAQSVIAGFDDAYAVHLGVNRVRPSAVLGVTASIGLSETAPDFALGVNWRVRLGV